MWHVALSIWNLKTYKCDRCSYKNANNIWNCVGNILVELYNVFINTIVSSNNWSAKNTIRLRFHLYTMVFYLKPLLKILGTAEWKPFLYHHACTCNIKINSAVACCKIKRRPVYRRFRYFIDFRTARELWPVSSVGSVSLFAAARAATTRTDAGLNIVLELAKLRVSLEYVIQVLSYTWPPAVRLV